MATLKANIIIACLQFSINAIPWPGPGPTMPVGKALMDKMGVSPEPTMKPLLRPFIDYGGSPLYDPFHMHVKRVNPGTSTGTCGYVDGNPAKPVTCPASVPVCQLVAAGVDSGGSYQCCPLDISKCTGYKLSCLEYLPQLAGRNSFQLTCGGPFSENSLPYCKTFVLVWGTTSTFSSYACDSVPSQTVYFYSATTTNGSAPLFTPSSAASPSSNNSNVGAIAGGAVGGAVAIAIICGILWLLRIKRRRKRRTNSPAKKSIDNSHLPEVANQTRRQDMLPAPIPYTESGTEKSRPTDSMKAYTVDEGAYYSAGPFFPPHTRENKQESEELNKIHGASENQSLPKEQHEVEGSSPQADAIELVAPKTAYEADSTTLHEVGDKTSRTVG